MRVVWFLVVFAGVAPFWWLAARGVIRRVRRRLVEPQFGWLESPEELASGTLIVWLILAGKLVA